MGSYRVTELLMHLLWPKKLEDKMNYDNELRRYLRRIKRRKILSLRKSMDPRVIRCGYLISQGILVSGRY